MKKVILLVISILLFGLSACSNQNETFGSAEQDTVNAIHPNYIADFTDTKQLVGAVHNVFVGKVISQTGNKKLGSIPETQFQVEVVENIKGNLTGTVKVNQQGGKIGGELVLVDGDKLLEPGKTYLFATRYLAGENWHTLVPNFGDQLIKDTNGQKVIVDKFKQAFKEEKPWKPENAPDNTAENTAK